MKSSVVKLMFAVVGVVCCDASDDDGSLLQLQRQNKQRSKTSLKAGTWKKSMQVSNWTAECECTAVGCGTSFCGPCMILGCSCACEPIVPDCNCCKGDRKCLSKKFTKMARRHLKDVEAKEEYKKGMDQYERKLLRNEREQEDQELKHQKEMRKHIRDEQDASWAELKLQHKKVKAHAKKRKEELNGYIDDLSDVVDAILHEIGGGISLSVPFEQPDPTCNCPPPVNCPPEPLCPICHNECAPCPPCTYLESTCENACEEDAIVQEYVNKYMSGHDWFLIQNPLPQPFVPVLDIELDGDLDGDLDP